MQHGGGTIKMSAAVRCKTCGHDICDSAHIVSTDTAHLVLDPPTASVSLSAPMLSPSFCVIQAVSCSSCTSPLGYKYLATTAECQHFTRLCVLVMSSVQWAGFVSVRDDTSHLEAALTASLETIRTTEIRINHLEACERYMQAAVRVLRKMKGAK